MEKDIHTDATFINGRSYQLALVTIKVDKWHSEGKLSGAATSFLIGELLEMADRLKEDPKRDYEELFANGLSDVLLQKLRDGNDGQNN